jgi:hypothetical protein
MPPCGPYVCRFPLPEQRVAGDRWTCPRCATTYRLTRPKPRRPWRRWDAPHGWWRVAWRQLGPREVGR